MENIDGLLGGSLLVGAFVWHFCRVSSVACVLLVSRSEVGGLLLCSGVLGVFPTGLLPDKSTTRPLDYYGQKPSRVHFSLLESAVIHYYYYYYVRRPSALPGDGFPGALTMELGSYSCNLSKQVPL